MTERWDKRKVWELLFAAMLFGEVMLLIYYNLALDAVYDQDAAKVLYHTVKIWENGGLIIPDWQYMTTGEWDCASFLAIFLYGMTGNIMLSFAISNILNILLFIGVVSLLLSTADVKRINILAALCILLIPYGWAMLEYTNMMFFSAAQYIYKVLTPLCLLAVFHYRDKYTNKAVHVILLLVTLLLLFLTITASGLYVAVCGIAAIYITRIIALLGGDRRWDRGNALPFVLSLLVIVVSYGLHVIWGVNSSADSMSLLALYDLPENFGRLLVSWLDVFHLMPESALVFSREGMTSVVRLPLILFLCVYGLPNCRRAFCLDRFTGFAKDAQKESGLLRAELISIFLMNAGIVLLTVPAVAERYVLIGVIPFVLAAIMTYDRIGTNPYLAAVLFAILCAVNVFSQYDGYIAVHSAPETPYTRALCESILEEAREENVDAIVIYYQSELSETLRAYDSDIEILTYQSGQNCFMDYDVVDGLRDISYIDDKACLIVMQGGVDMENTQDFIKAGYHYKDSIDEYSILVPN